MCEKQIKGFKAEIFTGHPTASKQPTL